MIEVDANGLTFEFPDGTTEEQIAQAIDYHFSGRNDTAVDNAIDVGGEFAAGVHRTVLGGVDVVGQAVDRIAGGIRGLATLASGGSLDEAVDSVNQRVVPTISDKVPGLEGGFMEPGRLRNFVATAGETLPYAVTAGQAARSLAAPTRQVPISQQTTLTVPQAADDTVTNVARTLGGGNAATDAGTAVVSAAGAEVGDVVGGETGRMIGAVAAPVAAGLARVGGAAALESRAVNKALKESAPDIGRLKHEARELYQQIDDLRVTVKQEPLERLATSIATQAKREGFNSRIHPKMAAFLDEAAKLTERPMTLSEVDTMRKVARGAAKSIEPEESRLGMMAIDRIDDFLDNLGVKVLQGEQRGEVGSLFKNARRLWSKAKRAEVINDAIERARNQASGFENGLRTQFRSILNNPRRLRGFTKDEIEAMQTVVRGGKAENIAKALGKFGFTEGQASSMLLSSLGAGAGAMIAGPGGAAVVPLAGQGFKQLAQSLTRRNVQLADELVKAGKDGRQIALAYLRRVPKGKRSVEELTGLLLDDDVTLEAAKRIDNKLASDAAYYASVIREGLTTPEPEQDEEEQTSYYQYPNSNR